MNLLILSLIPLAFSAKVSLLHKDLADSYETGTLITVFFKVNKAACKGEDCKTYIDLRTDTSSTYDEAREIPAIVQVSDRENQAVRTGAQSEISRTFGEPLNMPLGKKPSEFEMWTVDILKVSSNELRVFFQNTGGVVASTLRSMDDIKSVHLWTDEWTSASSDPAPQIQIHFPSNQILDEGQEQILARFNGAINDKDASRKVAEIASFPVGSHLHLVTFAKKSLFSKDDNKKSAVGLRGKQATGAFPVSIEYRWGHEDSSTEAAQSDEKKICFDDRVVNELAHMDIWRLNETAVLMELQYMRAPGATAAHCLSCIYNHPSYETELNQPLEIIEVQGAIVLHAHFESADPSQSPMKPDRCAH